MGYEDLLNAVAKPLAEYWALIVTAVIGVFATWFRDRIVNFVVTLFDAIARVRRIQRAINNDAPWLVKPPRPVETLVRSEIPILAIANLKGGVGKTTLAANLAGYFVADGRNRRRPGQPMRVLLIDRDMPKSW